MKSRRQFLSSEDPFVSHPDFRAATIRSGIARAEVGIVITVCSALLGILVPLVLQTRESAREMQTADQMREIGKQLHVHHDLFGRFPSGQSVNSGRKEFSTHEDRVTISAPSGKPYRKDVRISGDGFLETYLEIPKPGREIPDTMVIEREPLPPAARRALFEIRPKTVDETAIPGINSIP